DSVTPHWVARRAGRIRLFATSRPAGTQPEHSLPNIFPKRDATRIRLASGPSQHSARDSNPPSPYGPPTRWCSSGLSSSRLVGDRCCGFVDVSDILGGYGAWDHAIQTA